jgi:hypothetical protein
MPSYTGNSIFDILIGNNTTNVRVTDGLHTFTAGDVNLGNARVSNFYGSRTVANNTSESVVSSTYFSDVTAAQDNTMCIRIFHGDLTIGDNVTFRPPHRTKGMFVLVKGNLTIGSGSSISMTARGASAPNQNLSLWGNVTISGGHGTGGVTVTSNTTSTAAADLGRAGTNATGRGTGGGGSGASYAVTAVTVSGAGANGTVYAGGAGGGGIEVSRSSYSSTPFTANSGILAAGGDAFSLKASSGATNRGAGGGAGFPLGLGKLAASTTAGQDEPRYNGVIGTGGLLMVACLRTVTGHSTSFISNGSNGGLGLRAGGGGSGGGSVNVIGQTITTGTLGTATRGTGGLTEGADGVLNMFGGNGGNGTVTIKDLSLDGVSQPRRTLFNVGGTLYYRDFSIAIGTTGAWKSVGSAGSTATFETFGMFDAEVYALDRAAIASLYSNNVSAVNVQVYQP